MNVSGLLSLSGLLTLAAVVKADDAIVARGPHHDVHEIVTSHVENGIVSLVTNRFTLLQSGLNFYEENSWKSSVPQIELAQAGAAYSKGPFHLKLAPNHNDAVACVELTLPDHRVLKLQTVGVALTDISGDSVFIGELQDSVGVLEGNTVLYKNAFSGIKSDVRIAVSVGKWESDVILREQPVAPAALGWDPANVKLEIWHKLVEVPAAATRRSSIKRANGSLDSDEQIDFGDMMIGQGLSFLVGTNKTPLSTSHGRLQVAKERFTDPDSHVNFLIESVPYSEAIAHLNTLPARQEARIDWDALKPHRENRRSVAASGKSKRRQPTSLAKIFPGSGLPTQPGTVPRKIAGMSYSRIPEEPGFVMDYSVVLTASNFTFLGNTTYYITNEVNLTGTTVLEGATVLKFALGTTPTLKIHGSLDCKTELFLPAIMTAADDDSIGTQIAGSTGSPTDFYGDFHLYFSTAYAGSINLHDIHSRFARNAIGFYGATNHEASNLQLLSCNSAVIGYGNTVTLHNVLAENAGSFLLSATHSTTFKGEHFTAHNIGKLLDPDGKTNITLALTNSLIVVATNDSVGVTYDHVTTLSNDSGVFQMVGAGSHYLSSVSPYRDVGNPTLSATMLSILTQTTTFPPATLEEGIADGTTLTPRAQRDGDVPDLGAHFAPIDFMLDSVIVTNASVTISGGAVLGGIYGYGFLLYPGSRFVSHGTPKNPNRFVDYALVQEQPTRVEHLPLSSVFILPYNPTNLLTSSIDISFTEFIGNARYHLYGLDEFQVDSFTIRDSAFKRGSIRFQTFKNGVATGLFQNNLLERVSFVVDATNHFAFYNNLFWGGWVGVDNMVPNSLTFRDNVFDSVALNYNLDDVQNSHNAYINSTDRLYPTSTNDIVLSSFTYVEGTLGRYYQSSSNLFNAGSLSNAGDRGLFHYATKASQEKEAGGRLDVGLHYVALGANLLPLDTDGDGAADYIEDTNGNSVFDSGDRSNWQVVDTDGDGLPDGWEIDGGLNPLVDDRFEDADGDGLPNVYEYLYGFLPNDPRSSGGTSSSGAHTLCILANRTVVGWGLNSSGQLGDSTTIDRPSPVPVLGLSNVVTVVAVGNHSMALTSNGSAWTWGGNSEGQLGDTNVSYRAMPSVLLTNIMAIGAIQMQSTIVSSNGTVMTFGNFVVGE